MNDLRGQPGIRAVIFDFDGTIFDTETPTFEAWSETYRRHGAELDIEIWQQRIGSHGNFDPCAHLAALTGRKLKPEELREGVRRRVRELCSSEPMPGVAATLEETRELGLRTAIASSSSSGWVENWLDHLELRGYFQCVCGRDHVERVKPEPDLFLLAARRLGVEPGECLVFEDSPNGVRAARRAGMRCVAVPNALTRQAVFPPTDLEVESLAGTRLVAIFERLGQALS